LYKERRISVKMTKEFFGIRRPILRRGVDKIKISMEVK
jgi:hypothetical protein